MTNAKNICKKCGGKLVIEFIGNYGAVYPLKANGQPAKQRIRRIIYEESGDYPLIYCRECGMTVDPEEFEKRLKEA